MTDRQMPEGPFSGGCQCGAVRFQALALRDNPHVCYCRMCQKATGNLLAARGFCASCGTSLYYRSVGGPHVSISIGAFDEPHRIALWYQLGMEGKHPSLMHLGDVEEAGTTESAMADEAGAIKRTSHQHPDHDTQHWTPHPGGQRQ